ncbi:MAG: hypothetical protein Tsb009_14520 [Planctomycetaceae bacterium]
MTSKTVGILESSPRWVPELQRQFLGEGIRVRGIRFHNRDWTAADVSTSGTLVFALDVAEDVCLQFLRRIAELQQTFRVIVIGRRTNRELEWIFRDLGATHFVTSYVAGEELASICRRFLQSRTEKLNSVFKDTDLPHRNEPSKRL